MNEDLQQFEQLLKIMNKCHFKEIEGLEAIGFAQTYAWVAGKIRILKAQLQTTEEQKATQ